MLCAGVDDDTGVDRLDPAVGVHELDQDAVRVWLHPRRRDPPLENGAQRREMGLEDPLGLVLREAALELAAAVDAPEVQGANL
jgi:hypothetical protein